MSFIVRMKPALRAELEAAAEKRGVSMNREMIRRLRQQPFEPGSAEAAQPMTFSLPNFRLRQVMAEEAERIPRLRWCVVWTKPNAEFVAEEMLDAQEFDTFLPTRIAFKTPPGTRTRVKTVVPRFPRYLFVGIMPEQDWGPIYNTRGVHKLFASESGVPYAVPLKIINLIRQWSANERAVDEGIRPAWEEGQLLRVVSGLLEGHDVVFSRFDRDAAIVLLSIMGKEIEKALDPFMLAKK